MQSIISKLTMENVFFMMYTALFFKFHANYWKFACKIKSWNFLASFVYYHSLRSLVITK